jgi:uncharacterized protein (DUF1697 family)
MNYQIAINGIHCVGCKNLFTMVFEEQGFTDIAINAESGVAIFSSADGMAGVTQKLDAVFSDLKEYQYHDLNTIE